MKIVRTVAVALVLILAATATALWLNPPVGWLTNQAIIAVKQQTGRDLGIAGRRTLSLGPTSTVRLEDVTLGPAAGSGEPTVTAKAIEADFDLLPLLFRRVEVGRLRVEEPTVSLDAKPATRSAPTASGSGPLPAYVIGDIDVRGGRVIWRDATGAAPATFDGLDLKIDRVVAGEPVSASFAGLWRGEKVAGTVRVASIEALVGGGSVPLAVKLTSAKGTLNADGEATIAAEPTFKGKGSAATASLRDIAAWLGQPLPAGKGFAEARASGDVSVEAGRLSLTNARVVVDDTTFTGAVAAALPPARLKVTGKLAADRIDAGRYLDIAAEPASPQARRSRAPAISIQQVPIKESLKAYLAATSRGAQTDAAMQAAAGIEVRRSGPADDGWSAEPIDLDGLKAADADLEIAIKTLKVRSIEMSVPRMRLALESGALTIDAPKIDTGNGGLGGTMRVDARQPTTAFQTTFKLDELELRDLLGDVGLETFVAGAVSGEGEFKASGRSQREIVRSLDGTVKADIDRGAVVGWDVWSVIRNFGRLGPFDEAKRVPLDRVKASVAVSKGVARSQAAEAGGPVMRLRGEATARLPSRELQTQARVSLVPPPIIFPVALQLVGPWDDLKLTWGWDSVFGSSRSDPVQSPVGVVEGLDLKDPELAGLLRQALERARSTRSADGTAAQVLSDLLDKAEGR